VGSTGLATGRTPFVLRFWKKWKQEDWLSEKYTFPNILASKILLHFNSKKTESLNLIINDLFAWRNQKNSCQEALS